MEFYRVVFTRTFFTSTCVTQILWLQANDKSGFIIGLDPIPAQGWQNWKLLKLNLNATNSNLWTLGEIRSNLIRNLISWSSPLHPNHSHSFLQNLLLRILTLLTPKIICSTSLNQPLISSIIVWPCSIIPFYSSTTVWPRSINPFLLLSSILLPYLTTLLNILGRLVLTWLGENCHQAIPLSGLISFFIVPSFSLSSLLTSY
jgi:hypothetical protein